MFAPGEAWVTLNGIEMERVKFSDSHEAQDAAMALEARYPKGVVFVQYENGQPEIWESFI